MLIEQVPRVGKLEQVVGGRAGGRGARRAVPRGAKGGAAPREAAGAVAFVLCHVVEAVTHAAVLAELGDAPRRDVAAELTDMLLRYLPCQAGQAGQAAQAGQPA